MAKSKADKGKKKKAATGKKDKPPKKPDKKSKNKAAAKGKNKKKRKSMADKADRHKLYQASVQTPSADVEFFDRVYREVRGRKPLSLREDFCGTAYLSSTWVKSDAERTAVGIDIEPSVLDWGREHNLAKLSEEARGRVKLLEADVLDGAGDGGVDVACAMNFSYGVFFTREELRRYFSVVRDHLGPDGIFFTELYGGLEAVVELEETRDCDGFTYVWQQERYNPIDHRTLCHIHYEFPDGSKVKRAFTYDWRLWTIPEMRELLEDVGFSRVRVFWETTDEDGDGTGDYEPTEEEENQESWLVYIVAER